MASGKDTPPVSTEGTACQFQHVSSDISKSSEVSIFMSF